MTRALPANIDDPGFTPGVRHFGGLLELLAGPDPERAEQAEKALARAGAAAGEAVLERLANAEAPARARLARLLGKIARQSGSAAHREHLVALLGDEDPKARRNAIIALGKLGGRGIEEALIEAWTRAPLAHRRSLAEALGKVGGEAARALLEAAQTDDPELARLRDRALLMLGRSEARKSSSAEIVLDAALPREVTLVIRCRAGLSSLLLAEARQAGLRGTYRTGHESVELAHAGPLAPIAALRIAFDYAIALPLRNASDDAALLDVLDGEEARALLGALTRGPLRFRLAFSGGGHRRARVWSVASELARRGSPLVNDPTDAPWEAWIDERSSRLLLFPRGARDDRFAYRVRDVPAASHPTIAAALAFVAGARPNDVVWDPFVGSALELVERARLGPYRELWGTDRDPKALEAARANLAAAHARHVHLELGDMQSHAPPGVTLIVTNPPMGRRLARDRSLGPLVDAFAQAAARALGPDGRLVWLAPLPDRGAEALRARGFEVERRGPVDLGGFDAELQTARRAFTRRRRGPNDRRP